MASSVKPKMTLKNDAKNFRETKNCEVTHEYEEAKQAEADPQADEAMEEAKDEAKADAGQIVSTS